MVAQPPENNKEQMDFSPAGKKDTSRIISYDKAEDSENRALYFANGEAFTLGINSNYQFLTGITQSQVYGKNLAELENRLFKPSVTLKVLEEKRPISLIQHILTSNKKLLVTGNPLFNDNGKIIMVVTTVEPYDEREMVIVN